MRGYGESTIWHGVYHRPRGISELVVGKVNIGMLLLYTMYKFLWLRERNYEQDFLSWWRGVPHDAESGSKKGSIGMGESSIYKRRSEMVVADE